MAKQTTKANAPEVEEQPQIVTAERKPMTLAAKILLAKSKIGVIVKDAAATVDKTGKKVQYATLSTVLGAITPVLSEIGVDYIVSPVLSELAISLMAQNIRIFSLHFVDVESGEQSEPIVYPFRLATNYEAIKGDGSTITYATRYLLGLALGLQTEEDPDARFDNNGGKKQQQQQQQRTNNQQQAQQQQQPKKQRTFRECVTGFYATYNRGDLDGAKRTLDFVRKYWGHTDECAAEIAAMEKLDLTVWQPTTQPDTPQQSQAASAPADNTTAPF